MVHRKKQNRLRTILCESLEERRLMAATTQSLIASLAPEAPQPEAAIEAVNSSQNAASESAANASSESSLPVAESTASNSATDQNTAPQNADPATVNPEVTGEAPTGSDNSAIDSQTAGTQGDGSQGDGSQGDGSQGGNSQGDAAPNGGSQDDDSQGAEPGTQAPAHTGASSSAEASTDESEASSSASSEPGDSGEANATTDDAASDTSSNAPDSREVADLLPAVYENDQQQSSAADDDARNELPAYSEARAIQEAPEQELPAFSTAYPLPTDSQFVDANTRDQEPLNESPEEKIESVARTESTPIDNGDSQALPPGLRRGDALPPGLANRDELPYGLAKRANPEAAYVQPDASVRSLASETQHVVRLSDDTAVAESGDREPDAPRVEPAEASLAVDSPAAVEGESPGSTTDANQVAESRLAVTDTSPGGTQTEAQSSAPAETRSASAPENIASNPAGTEEAANSIAVNELPAEPQESAASPRENSSAFAGRGENERSGNNTSIASRQVTELPAASMSPDADVIAQRNSSALPDRTPPNRTSSNPASPNRTSSNPASPNLTLSNPASPGDNLSPPQNTIAIAPDAGGTSRGQLTTPSPASESANSPSGATSEFTASSIASNAAQSVAMNGISNEGQQPQQSLASTAPPVQSPPNVAARQALDVNVASRASEAVGAEAASPSSSLLANSNSAEQPFQNAIGRQAAEGFKDAQGQFVRSQPAENQAAENQSTARQFANHQPAARDEQSIVRQSDSAGIEVDNAQSIASKPAEQRNWQLPSADQLGEASPTPQQNGQVATDDVEFRYDAPKSLAQGMSNQVAEEAGAQGDGRPDKGAPNLMRLAATEAHPADLKSLIAQGIPEADAILALQKVLPVDQLSKLLPTSLVSSSGEQPTSPANSASGSSAPSTASIAQDMADDAEKEDGSASLIQPTVLSSSKLFRSVGASQNLRSEFALRAADTMPVHATPNERERNATVQEPVANADPTTKLNSSGNFRQTRLTGSSAIETKPIPTPLERIDRIEIEPGSHDSLPNEKHLLPSLESQFADSRADDAAPLAANDTPAEKSSASSAGVEIPAAVFFAASKLNANHRFRSLRKSGEKKRTDD